MISERHKNKTRFKIVTNRRFIMNAFTVQDAPLNMAQKRSNLYERYEFY